jgi:hypothetical protein
MPSVPEPDNPFLRYLIKSNNRSVSYGQGITVIVDLPCALGKESSPKAHDPKCVLLTRICGSTHDVWPNTVRQG